MVAITGCTVPKPPGNSPLRYRDQVFTGVSKGTDIQYGQAPDANGNPVALKLDLYQPTGDTETLRPALVWVHGGSFSGGDKTNIVPVDVANTFAKQGYVVVSINYRLLGSNCVANPNGCLVAALEAQHDAQAAVRWLRANAATYKIDPTRIGIGGESAGGITATLVALRSDDGGDSGNPGFSQRVQAFASISGGIIGGIFVDPSDTPAGIFFHGTADRVVPFSWSVDTAAAMREAGHYPYLERYDGAGHVPYVQFGAQMFEHTSYYFYWVLGLARADGQTATAARMAR